MRAFFIAWARPVITAFLAVKKSFHLSASLTVRRQGEQLVLEELVLRMAPFMRERR